MSKDVNPNSPTYNQYKFEYTDDHQDCSPLPDFQLVDGDTYRDENPGSPFYGEEIEFTDSTPTWRVFKQRCHEETYQPSGAVGQDGEVEEKKCDVNPKSATYQELTDWEIAEESDMECAAVSTDPILDYQERTIMTEQNPRGVDEPTGEVVTSYLDINKYSSTYGSTITEEETDESLIPDRRVKFSYDYGFPELHFGLPLNVRWAKNLYSPVYNDVAICLYEDNYGIWPELSMEPGYIRMSQGFPNSSDNVGLLCEGNYFFGTFYRVGLVDLFNTPTAGRVACNPGSVTGRYLKVFEADENLDKTNVDRSADVIELQLGYIRPTQNYESLSNLTNLRNLDLTFSMYDGSVKCDLSQNSRLTKITMSVLDEDSFDLQDFQDYISDNFILDPDKTKEYFRYSNSYQLKLS